MSSVEDHVTHWLAAGILDTAAAERIRAFERERPHEQRGPTFVEAVVYLGVLVAAVGAIILVGNNWEEMSAAVRVAVIGGAGTLAVAAGEAFRRLESPAMGRAGQVAFLVGGMLLTGAVAVFASSAGADENDTALAAGLTCLPLALVLWGHSPEHPQVAGVGLGILMFGMAWVSRFDGDSPAVGWFTIAVLGLFCLAATESGRFYPRASGRALATLCVAGGAFLGSTEGGVVEVVPFAAGVALIALSMLRRTFTYIVGGIAVVFAGLVQVILRHIDDQTLAALALMVIGMLLVGSVLVLARWRPWSHTTPAAA